MISSLVHHVRPDNDLIEKGRNMFLSFDSVHRNKSFVVLTYPPCINCDIVIAHNRDEPPKDCAEGTLMIL